MFREYLTYFNHENTACFCSIENIINPDSDELVERLVIKKDPSKSLKMSYVFGEGLRLVGENLPSKNNVLGEFLGIKKNDLHEYKSFFEKYGFLFQLNDINAYASVNINEIEKIKVSLQAFINLINNQPMDTQAAVHNRMEVDYKSLLDATLFLLFSENSRITLNDAQIYETPENNFLNTLKNIAPHNEINYNSSWETVNGQQIEVFYINDSLSESGTYRMEKSHLQTLLSDPHLPDICKKIIRSFKNKNQIYNDEDGYLIDFLFHFITQHSTFEIDNLNIEGTFDSDVYEDFKTNETLINSLIKISRRLIGTIFESYLVDVHPTYNYEDMKPDWKLPSLYSALYYSLFYLDPKEIGYRMCANTYCNEFFEVSRTNKRKIYCSTSCNNAASQRRYQRRRSR